LPGTPARQASIMTGLAMIAAGLADRDRTPVLEIIARCADLD
jgi:hypothetical protein